MRLLNAAKQATAATVYGPRNAVRSAANAESDETSCAHVQTLETGRAGGLQPEAHRLHCDAPLHAKRITRSYCSDRCRKAAKRAEGYLPERRVLSLLAQRGLIG